jgi:hypothetical protein
MALKKAPEFAPDILHRNAIFCFTSNKQKAPIPFGIRAFPNFAFLISGPYGTLTYNFTKYHKLATIY